MYVCPLCNQLKSELTKQSCPDCQMEITDQGRLLDYFDDYSPYQEIEGMKVVDGFSKDYQQHKCPHLFSCNNCGNEKVILINEEKM